MLYYNEEFNVSNQILDQQDTLIKSKNNEKLFNLLIYDNKRYSSTKTTCPCSRIMEPMPDVTNCYGGTNCRPDNCWSNINFTVWRVPK